MSLSIDDLRRFAVTRSLFPPTTLKRAIQKLALYRPTPFVRRRGRRT